MHTYRIQHNHSFQGGKFRCVTCCKVTCSVIGHLGMMACLVTIIVHLTFLSSVSDPGLVFGLSCGMLALAYIIMLIEVRCSDTHKYVSNFLKEGTLHQHISTMCNTRPSITWSLECYHYETRYRTVSSTDSNGHTTYRTESYQERVVTYRDSLVYEFSQWRDVSPPPPPVARGVATRVRPGVCRPFVETELTATSWNFSLCRRVKKVYVDRQLIGYI